LRSNSSSGLLDPAPTSLLKRCHSVISAPISHFINAYLTFASFPLPVKTAAVTHVFKKPNLEPSVLYNYFKCTFLVENSLFDPAFVKVVNDLFLSGDSGSLTILLLLDLSSAFEMVSSEIPYFSLLGCGYYWCCSFLAFFLSL